MRPFGLLRRFGLFGNGGFKRNGHQQSRRSASLGQPLSSGSPSQPRQANPWLKAACTSGSLCLAGDLLAQTASRRSNSMGTESVAWDRSARMGTFGLLFYGPFQHWWYGLLNQQWPLKVVSHFATKVALNQLVLGPIVTTVVFTWNLLLQQQSQEIPRKLKRDLVPTMVNGWKFWIPASSINFMLVPLQSQVLYMSVCGLLWTAYLSYSSNKQPQLVKA